LSDYILELKNIGKTFSGVNVLRGIDLQVKRGEVLALMGENGAGKSTLIKVISGYHQPDEGGQIIVDGKEVVFHNPKESLDAHIHTIYQELTLCPDMTVAENIVIDKQDSFKGPVLHTAEFKKMATDAINKLGMDINPDVKVRELSIAKRQIVEIAKAISSDAELIIMDEPTSSISEKDADALLDIVKELRNSGLAIIYISHRMAEIQKIADRVCVLRDGSHVGTLPIEEASNDKLISLMVGRTLDNAYPKAEVELGEVVLKVENLCSDVFKNVSFEVRKGEICGIGGLVGAKRTEILECLFGIRKIESGKIYLYGQEWTPKNEYDAISKDIAFVTEDRKKNGVVQVLSINDNINMVNADHIASKNGVINAKQFKEISERQRKALNIKLANIQQPVSSLSGGNMQKVVIAKWMEMDPKIILFDEPTRGIDIGAKAEIYSIMADFVKKGAAILMVSSELPELLSVTDKIVVMCEGAMTGIVNRGEATQELIMKLSSPTAD